MKHATEINFAHIRIFICAGFLLLIISGCTTVDLGQRDIEDRTTKPDANASEKTSANASSNASPNASVKPSSPASAQKNRGGYYRDDGPDAQIPEGLLETPDAEPRVEPYARGPSRPYEVFGKNYTPITDNRPFVQRGVGSWYGKKFHGQRTASGEIYDMYKMTAAHPTLPLPSYARITNLRNGKQVTVRINDRGPFHSERIIDLSYTAALKLGYIGNGSSELQVERLLPEEIARINAEKYSRTAAPVNVAQEDDAIGRIAASGSSARVTADSGGYYLQFGAYAQIQNAQLALDRLLPLWPQDLPLPSLLQEQGLYRLRSGPFPGREEASKAASALQSASQIVSTVVQK